MEPEGKSGMQGVFGLILVAGGIVLIVMVLADLANWNPLGNINLNPFDVGTLPPTAAPGSGKPGTPTAGRGTPGGCPQGYHSAIIGGRYPGCVKD